jgi:hypothetical protein
MLAFLLFSEPTGTAGISVLGSWAALGAPAMAGSLEVLEAMETGLGRGEESAVGVPGREGVLEVHFGLMLAFDAWFAFASGKGSENRGTEKTDGCSGPDLLSPCAEEVLTLYLEQGREMR